MSDTAGLGREGCVCFLSLTVLFLLAPAAVVFLSVWGVPAGCCLGWAGQVCLGQTLSWLYCCRHHGSLGVCLSVVVNPVLVLVKAVIGGLLGHSLWEPTVDMLLKELAFYKEKSVFSRLYSKWCFMCVYQMWFSVQAKPNSL